MRNSEPYVSVVKRERKWGRRRLVQKKHVQKVIACAHVILTTQAYMFSNIKQWPVTLIPLWQKTIIAVYVGSILAITGALLMQSLFQKLGNILIMCECRTFFWPNKFWSNVTCNWRRKSNDTLHFHKLSKRCQTSQVDISIKKRYLNVIYN